METDTQCSIRLRNATSIATGFCFGKYEKGSIRIKVDCFFSLASCSFLTRYLRLGKDKDLIRFLVKSGEKLPEGQATNVPPFFDDLMKLCVQFDPLNRPMFHDILLMIRKTEQN